MCLEYRRFFSTSCCTPRQDQSTVHRASFTATPSRTLIQVYVFLSTRTTSSRRVSAHLISRIFLLSREPRMHPRFHRSSRTFFPSTYISTYCFLPPLSHLSLHLFIALLPIAAIHATRCQCELRKRYTNFDPLEDGTINELGWSKASTKDVI